MGTAPKGVSAVREATPDTADSGDSLAPVNPDSAGSRAPANPDLAGNLDSAGNLVAHLAVEHSPLPASPRKVRANPRTAQATRIKVPVNRI